MCHGEHVTYLKYLMALHVANKRNGKVVHWYYIHAGKYNNYLSLPMDITLSHNC